MSSVICDNIKVSVFGESHGEAIGCVIDGLPAGVKLDMDKIYLDMSRRAPGKDKYATPRLEKDIPHILSGVLNDITTGAPLAMVIQNRATATIRLMLNTTDLTMSEAAVISAADSLRR